MKNLFFFLLIFVFFTNNSYSSIKENIIKNLKTIDNLSFNFKQTIDEKEENGNCTIEYPKKIYCNYDLKFKKILVSNGKSLVIKSEKNNQYYIYPLTKTPFNLLLNKNYLLKNISSVDSEIIDNKYVRFQINDNNYLINIFFDYKSYEIICWQTEDIYKNLVVTFIYDLKKNIILDKKIFDLPEQN